MVSLQTLGRREEVRGVLAVAMPEPPDAATRAVITVAVALMEFAVADQRRRWETRLVLDEQAVRLCGSGHTEAAEALLATDGRDLPSAPLVLLQVAGLAAGTAAEQEVARRCATELPVLCARWQGRLLVVGAAGRAKELTGLLATEDTAVVRGLAADWSGIEQWADRAATAVGSRPIGSPVGELGRDGVLGLLPDIDLGRMARQRLAALGPEPEGARQRAMLGVWLRHNGAWEPAARELGRHRHTLKAQVAAAGEALGLDLTTFAGRAELWLLLQALEQPQIDP